VYTFKFAKQKNPAKMAKLKTTAEITILYSTL
jgi:hypothetical protein